MNKIFLGTNLKMYKGYQETLNYVSEVNEITQVVSSELQIFVIPSFLTIKESVDRADDKCWIGSQNMSDVSEGAFTGEISPSQLKEIGVKINELGHSERRNLFGEKDEELAKKVKTSITYEMKPLLCVGENALEKDSDASVASVTRQIEIGLSKLDVKDVDNILIAYEPVWAIGENGVPAKPEYVEKVHDAIRECLVKKFDDFGNTIPVLYGGSVNLENYQELLSIGNVNGLFIGRTAWDIQKFKEIILYIEKNKNKFLGV